MKKYILFVLTILTLSGFSQDYFQQKVAYKIDVTLNDENNTLSGFEIVEYENNSPDALSFVYMHLWPNAYKNNETALANQLEKMGNTTLERGSEEERGYIDSLDFKVNGKKVTWMYEENHIDICKIVLEEPLKSGEKIEISTPFKVKIPSGSISRLGHIGQSYQITQWYPKPAVYDKEGWHQMPYLTQGEFYSEYGSFDVSITLPKNYVVGATGDLQTQSEIDFLNKKAKQTDEKYKTGEFSDKKRGNSDFPASDYEMKTIRYTQKNVHDFAWFADKRFEVLKGEVELPASKRKVTSWAMFVGKHSNIWEDAIEYLNDATFYYSKWNGDYPYNHVTAVDGTISAGGGMEYPNVTVIGATKSKEELEVVIVHEVGHNWFYGLLGSNERDHAWMDEGLNTMNEIRYMQTKYPNNQRLSDMAGGIAGKLHFEHLNHQDISDLTYQAVAGHGLDQPIELHSADFTSLNYGAIVYSKTGLVFTYLKDYLGEELFDKAMHKYYDKWHYKHPQPEDIKRTLEKETGKNLDWLFEDLIKTTKHIDYKIKKVKIGTSETTVTVKNAGQINGPIRVDAYSLGQLRDSKWIDPSDANVKSTTFDGISYDKFVIDGNKQIPELNRNNNTWSKKGLFHKVEPFKLEFLAGDNEGNRWNNFWLPVVGGNVYDKLMLGIVLHNQTLPKNPFEYTIAPLFSFGRKNVAGFADFNYSWIPATNFRMITLGLEGKTFGHGLHSFLTTEGAAETYYVARPYMTFEIGKSPIRKSYKQQLKLMGHYVTEESLVLPSKLLGGTLNYRFILKKKAHRLMANVRLDYFNTAMKPTFGATLKSDLLNLGAEVKYTFEYWKRKKKSIELRAFVGKNAFYNGLTTSNRYGFSLGGQSGMQDVTYENYLFGRNELNGFWSNQRIENQGGFKTTSSFGTSTDMLIATNLYAQLPYLPFVGFFADYGVFNNEVNLEAVANLGFGIRIVSILGVYFPIYESTNLKNSFPLGTKYSEKIRFTLNLTGLNIKELVSKVAE